jgi:hypothetical protein
MELGGDEADQAGFGNPFIARTERTKLREQLSGTQSRGYLVRAEQLQASLPDARRDHDVRGAGGDGERQHDAEVHPRPEGRGRPLHATARVLRPSLLPLDRYQDIERRATVVACRMHGLLEEPPERRQIDFAVLLPVPTHGDGRHATPRGMPNGTAVEIKSDQATIQPDVNANHPPQQDRRLA